MRFKPRSVYDVLALALLILLLLAVPTASAKIVGLASKYKPVPADGQATQKLACPKGMHVIGGGGYTTGSSLDDQLAESAPFDGRDDNRKPDDGWLASVNSASPDKKMKTFATCSDKLAVVYKHHPSNLTAAGSESFVECPTGKVPVGGGVTVDGHPLDTPMAASTPAASTPGSYGWYSWTRSPNGNVGVVYAVCARRGSGGSKITYHDRTGDVGPGRQDVVTAPCPQGSRLLGGGATQIDFGEEGDLDLAALNPSDATGSFKKPWTQWEGWLNNGETISVALTTTAICRG
jgi:hypothetical protein